MCLYKTMLSLRYGKGGIQLSLPKNVKHDLLLVIVSMLFILFITGCASTDEESSTPIIIPQV